MLVAEHVKVRVLDVVIHVEVIVLHLVILDVTIHVITDVPELAKEHVEMIV